MNTRGLFRHTDSRTFTVWYMRLGMGIPICVMMLVFLSLLLLPSVGSRVFGIICAAILAVLAYRTLRTATVVASPTRVVIRSTVRTRRFRWSEIRSFSTAIGRVGVNPLPRVVLVVQLASSEVWSVGDFNSWRRPGRRPYVEVVAASLNQMLAEHVGGG